MFLARSLKRKSLMEAFTNTGKLTKPYAYTFGLYLYTNKSVSAFLAIYEQPQATTEKTPYFVDK